VLERVMVVGDFVLDCVDFEFVGIKVLECVIEWDGDAEVGYVDIDLVGMKALEREVELVREIVSERIMREDPPLETWLLGRAVRVGMAE